MIQLVNATLSQNLSTGVRNPNVLRGLWFNRIATSFNSACEYPERSVFFGKY